MKNFGKNYESRLTDGAACAIVYVTGFETRQEAVAAAVKGDISTGKITAFRLLGRMGRACPGVSSCTFRTHSPLFRAFESAGKATEALTRRRHESCTAVSSRRNFNSSPDGSSSGVSTPEADAGAANANSENSPTPPVRLRSRSKSTRSTRRSTTRYSRSICSVRNFAAGRTQKTHCAPKQF